MFEIKKDVSLKDYCTFRIGGKAKFLVEVKNNTTLIEVCLFCLSHNIKYKIIGLGANLLFDDLGFDGMIIVNKTSGIKFNKSSVIVDSGVNLTSLIMKCYMRSLCNFESLAGIPSTIGGGVVNSVGAFNTTLTDFVEYVECYHISDLKTKLKLNKNDCKFSYRDSIFKNNNYIITKVKLNLIADKKENIKARIDEAINKKSSTQPLNLPSAGSVFKRCDIIPAKVIDELGLKGTKIGDAEISRKHAGFIVNLHSATSKDVKNLISFVQKKVKKELCEVLEPEIEFVEY